MWTVLYRRPHELGWNILGQVHSEEAGIKLIEALLAAGFEAKVIHL